ncbi:MAG: hypothetical protein KDA96_03680 [Planctomycetaceae bacterium]|nr:hypothetical protein [Planctomycetaceae bacterium]
MLRIDRTCQKLTPLEQPSLSEAMVRERYDLQEFICNSPDVFFQEIGQELFLIGKEVQPSESVQDRIDILAIDKDGTCVIVELKRGNHKLQLFQAISYAGMIADWESNSFLEDMDPNQRDTLEDFLEVEIEDINREQRVVLIAEAFDFALLKGAEWLSERHNIDIRCCRISLAKDTSDGNEFLVCSNVYPAPELIEQAVARRRKTKMGGDPKWSDWDEALKSVTNQQVASFFRGEIEKQREQYLPKRTLFFRIAGKRRWFVRARQNLAYVWQYGRFQNDVGFWVQELGDDARVEPIADGKGLRCFLSTKRHFDRFREAATRTLTTKEWIHQVDDEQEDGAGPDAE